MTIAVLKSIQEDPSKLAELTESLKHKTTFSNHLVYGRLVPLDIKNLIQALKCCPNMLSLDLSYSDLDLNAALGLAEYLKTSSITHLTLANCNINVQGLNEILDALVLMANINHLDFNGTPIYMEASTRLGSLIKERTNLKHINLAATTKHLDHLYWVLDKLQYNTSLNYLNLSNNNKLSKNKLANFLKSNKTLTHLVLDSLDLFVNDLESLNPFFENNSQLTHLSLAFNKLSTLGSLKNCRKLTYLALDHNLLGTQESNIKSLAETIKNNEKLIHLDLSANAIAPKDAKLLASALEKHTNLEKIDLSYNKISSSGLNPLLKSLEASKAKLTTLSLHSNTIDSQCSAALQTFLEKNSALSTLGLRNNAIGREGVTALTTALMNNNTLSSLDLSDNALSDESIPALASFLKQNKTLKVLKLGKNNISANGLISLTQSLKNNLTLEELHIQNMDIEYVEKDEAINALEEYIKSNTGLHTLVLDNSIGPENVAILTQAALQHNKQLSTLSFPSKDILEEPHFSLLFQTVKRADEQAPPLNITLFAPKKAGEKLIENIVETVQNSAKTVTPPQDTLNEVISHEPAQTLLLVDEAPETPPVLPETSSLLQPRVEALSPPEVEISPLTTLEPPQALESTELKTHRQEERMNIAPKAPNEISLKTQISSLPLPADALAIIQGHLNDEVNNQNDSSHEQNTVQDDSSIAGTSDTQTLNTDEGFIDKESAKTQESVAIKQNSKEQEKVNKQERSVTAFLKRGYQTLREWLNRALQAIKNVLGFKKTQTDIQTNLDSHLKQENRTPNALCTMEPTAKNTTTLETTSTNVSQDTLASKKTKKTR